MPDDEHVIADRKVYTWYSSTFDEGTQLQCRIRVVMAGDVIGSYDFEGNIWDIHRPVELGLKAKGK
jgi:hypothetical protein